MTVCMLHVRIQCMYVFMTMLQIIRLHIPQKGIIRKLRKSRLSALLFQLTK